MMSHGVTATRRIKDEPQNGFRVGDVMHGARACRLCKATTCTGCSSVNEQAARMTRPPSIDSDYTSGRRLPSRSKCARDK